MPAIKLSVGECLKKGWETFKSRPWFFVGVTLIMVLVQVFGGWAQEAFRGPIGFIISLIVSTLLYAGILNLFLIAHDDASKASYKDLWNPKPFVNYLLVSLLLVVVISVGILLLVVPGIFAMLVFFFAGYVVIDKGMGPIKALKESARLTKGNRFNILLLFLAMLGLTILGMIPFFLGLFVVAPVVAVASVHAYRTLSGGEVAA